MKILPVRVFKVLADGRSVQELKHRLATLNAKAQEIQASADAQNRELTAEEQRQIDQIFDEFELTEADITRRETIAAHSARLSQPEPRQVPPTDPAGGAAPAAGDQPQNRGGIAPSPRRPRVEFVDKHPDRWGFANFGEFALVVAMRASNGGAGQVDNRLIVHNALSTASSEGVGADGGILVPPEFRREVAQKITEGDALLARCDQMPCAGNSMSMPLDETSPWGTSGVQAAWADEMSTLSQSKVALTGAAMTLHKLTALVPVTEELNADQTTLDGYLRRRVPVVFDQKISEAIVRGNGVGKPLGLINASCAITVAAESGPQTADTIVMANITKMWSRMPDKHRRNAVWLANQDIEPQLLSLTFTGSNPWPAYLPPGGLSASPYGTLMGRPIISCESCSVLGDAGDLILVDLSQYLALVKSGGIKTDVSMHLWFDQDTLAYRFIFRMAGQPWWKAPWQRRDSNSPTLSPIVVLGDRTGS